MNRKDESVMEKVLFLFHFNIQLALFFVHFLQFCDGAVCKLK